MNRRRAHRRTDPVAALTPVPAATFDSLAGERALLDTLGVADLGAFGTFSRGELAAVGALLKYVELTQIGARPAIRPPRKIRPRRRPDDRCREPCQSRTAALLIRRTPRQPARRHRPHRHRRRFARTGRPHRQSAVRCRVGHAPPRRGAVPADGNAAARRCPRSAEAHAGYRPRGLAHCPAACRPARSRRRARCLVAGRACAACSKNTPARSACPTTCAPSQPRWPSPSDALLESLQGAPWSTSRRTCAATAASSARATMQASTRLARCATTAAR